jgi:L-alanine-DL-glutamate epimerase-like enolase superfamily enzyme
VVVELVSGDTIAHGYAHVWAPATLPVARDLGMVCSANLVGTTPAEWAHVSRRGIENGPLRAIGTRGLGGVVVSALDLAMWDLATRHQSLALEQVLGGEGPADAYSCDGLFGHIDASGCAAAAERLIAGGVEAVKLYVTGRQRAAEHARLAAVRDVIGPSRDLYIDAASAYTTESARWMLDLAAEFGVRWVEDPIAKDDLAGLADLAAVSPVPLAGGQECSVADLARLLDAVPIAVVLIDLQQVVGISGWLDAVDIAAGRGVRVTSHAYTHVAARLLAGARMSVSQVQHAHWDNDFLGPVTVHEGRVIPPDGPGAVPPPIADLNWISVNPTAGGAR